MSPQTVVVKLKDGGEMTAVNVRQVEIHDGMLWLDGRRIPLENIERMEL